ncbi:MAG: hypothetical protein DCF32_14410 [Leptolyngbya sp.]|nr:MAG: hypothetical protein DCF32_14410 [Leptolyngbya sp.]
MALSGAAQRAKKIREQLKATFPGVKFSVRTHNYSGGDSVNVKWEDGPRIDDVKKITSQFESISYCQSSGEILGGGNSYVMVERSFSEAHYAEALKSVCKYWGLEVPGYTTQKWGCPYLDRSQDVQNVGNGIQSLGELVRQHLGELDLRPTSAPTPAAPAPATDSQPASDMEVVENDDLDGFELFFNGKPDDGLRQILKEHGFRPAKKKTGDRVGQWFWYASRSDERREFLANLLNLFAPEHPATIGGKLAGDTSTYTEFMRATSEPKTRRAEDRDGKLIGGQFEYDGRLFLIEPVNNVASGYKTIGYRLILGGHSRLILTYNGHRPNSYFRSVTEARRAAFWYLSGEKATALDLSVFCQIFRKTDQIAWLLETVGGTTFRNQLVDRDLTGWSHEEIAVEALAMLEDRHDSLPPSLKEPAPAAEALAPKPDPKLAKRAADFRSMADRLQATVDHKLAPRLENTAKRAREAEAQRRDGYQLQGVQAILRAIADQADNGTLAHPLSAISSKSHVESLMESVKYFEMTEAEASNHPACAQGWQIPQIIASYGTTAADVISGKARCSDVMAKLKLTPEQMVELLRQLKAIVRGDVVIDHNAEQLKRAMAELRYCGIPGYVATPRPLGEQAIAFLDITDDDYVLDPQGGSGALLNVIRVLHPGTRLATLETSDRLSKILQLQGFDVLGDDSMEYRPKPDERPTKIAMNPPFEGMADIDHVLHAYDILAPGGTMVAIIRHPRSSSLGKKPLRFGNGSTRCRSFTTARKTRPTLSSHRVPPFKPIWSS